MNCWTRRQFGCLAGAACLTALVPRVARGQAKSRVVVIGGGIGGATVARYLAASAGTIEVTLVEPKLRYATCFFSSLYLAGMRSFESLTHGYERLAQQYGINVIHDTAVTIDPVAKTVALKGGGHPADQPRRGSCHHRVRRSEQARVVLVEVVIGVEAGIGRDHHVEG